MSGPFCRSLGIGTTEPFTDCGNECFASGQNGHEFIQKAAEILPKPIEIIAGREEARLIYLGVSHTMTNTGRRLVVDIGGGSTELIIGEEFEPIHTESVQMGCVTFTKKFFADGEITHKAFDKAVTAARKEISGIANTYKSAGWDAVVGSSGTIKACRQICVNMGWSNDKEQLTREGLENSKINYSNINMFRTWSLKV